ALGRRARGVGGGVARVAPPHVEERIRAQRRGQAYVLSMRLPFAEREALDMHRRGDELFVKVGAYKRNLILPQTLQRLAIRDASFVDDRLEIRFAREPRPMAEGARAA